MVVHAERVYQHILSPKLIEFPLVPLKNGVNTKSKIEIRQIKVLYLPLKMFSFSSIASDFHLRLLRLLSWLSSLILQCFDILLSPAHRMQDIVSDRVDGINSVRVYLVIILQR